MRLGDFLTWKPHRQPFQGLFGRRGDGSTSRDLITFCSYCTATQSCTRGRHAKPTSCFLCAIFLQSWHSHPNFKHAARSTEHIAQHLYDRAIPLYLTAAAMAAGKLLTP